MFGDWDEKLILRRKALKMRFLRALKKTIFFGEKFQKLYSPVKMAKINGKFSNVRTNTCNFWDKMPKIRFTGSESSININKCIIYH